MVCLLSSPWFNLSAYQLHCTMLSLQGVKTGKLIYGHTCTYAYTDMRAQARLAQSTWMSISNMYNHNRTYFLQRDYTYSHADSFSFICRSFETSAVTVYKEILPMKTVNSKVCVIFWVTRGHMYNHFIRTKQSLKDTCISSHQKVVIYKNKWETRRECAHLYVNSYPGLQTFWRQGKLATQMVRWWIEAKLYNDPLTCLISLYITC